MKICKMCNGMMIIGSSKWWNIVDVCPNCDGTGMESIENDEEEKK